MDAVVMAAGEGTRLRPLTNRWPKPVLPIDGRAVVSTMLRDLRAAGAARVWVVTGYLAEQVEALLGDGSGFGLHIEFVRQPGVLGSADAVQRALAAGAEPPLIVSAADTVFGEGDVARFTRAFADSSAAGAVAIRTDPEPSSDRPAVRRRDGFVERFRDDDPANPWGGAPLWGLGAAIVPHLGRDAVPHELANAYQAAIEAGERVVAIEIGKTRDLTYPLDLVEENFPYLRSR